VVKAFFGELKREKKEENETEECNMQ